MNAHDLSRGLAHFTGSEQYYRHGLTRARYTEGVRFLAENAGGGAYWLLDVIFSHQLAPAVRAEPFQVWRLDVTGSAGVVTCTDGGPMGEPERELVRQEIPFTDFPLPTITLWLQGGVLYLPSEH